MKILKFGGTSLGSAERIQKAAEIIQGNENCMVVCSAMSGMTNALLGVVSSWETDGTHAATLLEDIQTKFNAHFAGLAIEPQLRLGIDNQFEKAARLLTTPYDQKKSKSIIVLGEQVTSEMLQLYLLKKEIPARLLDALGFVHLNEHDEPDTSDIAANLEQTPAYTGTGVYITQGFICRDARGEITTLSRGGSDFTATLLGAALNAELIEIWTDIDGMHNNDPRHVPGTSPIRELSYTEAAELAYFGAKILHPSCVRPAREKNIPISIKNSFDRFAPGTTIQAETPSTGIRAIAAKDNITILRITSGRMFNAYGFLSKVFEIFSTHKTPVDVVTTSEVSVSVTIEDPGRIHALVNDLEQLGRVDREDERCIICVVGDVLQPGHIATIFQHLKKFDIRMVSLGASSNNITFVLPISQKIDALNAIHPVFHTLTENSLSTWIR